MTRSLLLRLLCCAAVVAAAALCVPALSRPAAEEKEKPLGKLPADLALVPRDATMFVSIRLSELAALPGASQFLDELGLGGALYLSGKVYSEPQSNVERLTAFGRRAVRSELVIVRTKKPYDGAALRKHVSATRELKAHGKTFFAGVGDYPRAVWPVDETTFVVGEMRALVPYLAVMEKPAKTHALADELQEAGKHTAAYAVQPSLVFRAAVSAELERRKRWEGVPRKDAPRDLPSKDGAKKKDIKDKKGVRAEFLRVQFKEDKKDGRRPERSESLEVEDIKEEELKLNSLEECFDHRDRFGPMSAPLRPYVRASRLLVTLDVGAEVKASARASFASEADAKDGETAGKMALILLRDGLPFLLRNHPTIDGKDRLVAGLVRDAQKALSAVEVKREGKVVEGSGKMKLDAAALSKWADEQLPLLKDRDNLKQIGIGFHAYHDTYKQFPAQAISEMKGRFGMRKPLLSWRVALLPYLGEGELYKQFKLNEAWDSAHNKKLIARMPKVYAAPGRKAVEPGITYYQVFVGPKTLFRFPDVGSRIYSIKDGTSNTFLVAESSKAVPWTKPEDMEATDKALPKLGGQFKGFLHVAFFDGSVMRIKANLPERVLRPFITPSGGEVVDHEQLHP